MNEQANEQPRPRLRSPESAPVGEWVLGYWWKNRGRPWGWVIRIATPSGDPSFWWDERHNNYNPPTGWLPLPNPLPPGEEE